jgi:hypothetical protein
MEGMKTMTTHAHKLGYDLLDLMPRAYQRASLKAMLALVLQKLGAWPFPNAPSTSLRAP